MGLPGFSTRVSSWDRATQCFAQKCSGPLFPATHLQPPRAFPSGPPSPGLHSHHPHGWPCWKPSCGLPLPSSDHLHRSSAFCRRPVQPGGMDTVPLENGGGGDRWAGRGGLPAPGQGLILNKPHPMHPTSHSDPDHQGLGTSPGASLPSEFWGTDVYS